MSPPAPPREGAPGGERLPRSSRIRHGGEIRKILRTGRRHRTAHLEVFIAPAPEGRPRYGTIVPKHGNRIVDRNRLRRRLRELGRTRVLPPLRASGRGIDVLVRTRPNAYGAPFGELRDQLDELTERLCSEPSS
jgi:ribonuclease P protein component